MAKQLLRERFTVSKENITKLPLKESEQIIEKDGTSYKCRGAYEMPVWKLDQKNLNERVYPKELAEKLIKEERTTLGMANHPDGDGDADVKDSFAVERNPHIKEGTFYVDVYLVGENGQLANEILEAGGEIGLSSSGYGDVDNNGYVLAEEYEIERFADWVDNPSFQVYGTKESKKESKVDTEKSVENKQENSKNNETTEEVANKQSELSEENVTNSNRNKEEDKKSFNQNNVKKENKMSDTQKKSLEEKTFEMNVKRLFQEAEGTEDLREKKGKYEDILDYCEGVDLDFAESHIEEANGKIKEIEEQLFELADKGKEVEPLKESAEEGKKLKEQLEEKENELKETKEKLDKAYEMLDDFKEREAKVNELYQMALAEKNGMVKAKEYKELYAYCDKVEKELEEQKRENRKLKKRTNESRQKFSKPLLNKRKRPSREKVEGGDESESEELEEDVGEDDYSKYTSPNLDEIIEWYEAKKEQNPRVAEIKDKLLSKRTLSEAQREYMKYRDLIEDVPSPYKSGYYQLEEDNEEVAQNKRKSYYSNGVKIREGWD